MKKRIPIGIEFYKEMIDKDYYYIDKTLLIKEILDSGAKVSLLTRPRRFGKTLAVTMLKDFFEDERDSNGNKIDNSCYFKEKKISDCGDVYLSKQGRYPIINLTLKSANQPDYEMIYGVLKKSIIEEFGRHFYILQGQMFREDEIQKFQQILKGEAKPDDYATALAFLSQCLKKYHNSNVVILIDEYDVPLENAYFRGFYHQIVDFIRSLFESVLKTNNALEFAVITGCLRISKESIFTGLNNLEVVSLLNKNYAEYFGFTSSEVEEMLQYYKLEEKLQELKKWYDGYYFGNTEIYNPWSVINYIKTAFIDFAAFPKPYWSNTSSNSIVKDLIEGANQDTKKEIENLLAGGTIEKPVHEDITYDDIHKSGDNLWNFLFFTGYLKKVGERFEISQLYLEMAIPNQEVHYIYENTISHWFDQKVKAMDRTELYQAVVQGNCLVVETILREQLKKSISFYDAAEQFYHGFLVGMLSGLGEYVLQSNRETGDGRADIIMTPADERQPVMIFELKRAERFTHMEERCQAALSQIEDRHYDAESRDEGYKRFIKYGICFCKKSCMVAAVIESPENKEKNNL